MKVIATYFHFSEDFNTIILKGFPGGSDGKESACNVGDLGLIPRLGRSPGEENGNPLQYSCLENPHGQRSLAGYSPWGHKGSDVTEWLSTAQQRLWRGAECVIPKYATWAWRWFWTRWSKPRRFRKISSPPPHLPKFTLEKDPVPGRELLSEIPFNLRNFLV